MTHQNDFQTLAPPLFATVVLLASTGGALAAVRYVDVNSATSTAPYTNWATAATNIQDAVDAGLAGDEIVVANGHYTTGGRDGNRVQVDKPLHLWSASGAQSTIIDGGFSGGCVYLTNGATLSGFTLTNGRAYYGAGVFCESLSAIVSNCAVMGNWAQNGGGAVGGTLNNCSLIGNMAHERTVDVPAGDGGGALGCTLNNCILSGNGAGGYGGGAAGCWLTNCRLSGNGAGAGAGAVDSTLVRCTLRGNEASGGRIGPSGAGGGALGCDLINCTLTGNWSSGDYGSAGGGAAASVLNNCTVSGNFGYGVIGCTLNGCTLTGNTVGAASSGLNNCILYFNTGQNYDPACALNYCCTTPLPTKGVGNISSDPQLADFSHVSAGSPCRGAGSADFASGIDIDGDAWANPPSIGCDEYRAGTLVGPLSVNIAASYTNVLAGFAVQLTALIEGPAAASSWDFGDGVTATNQPYTSHAWTTVGDYAVVLHAYNESLPGEIMATVTVHVVTGVHYVDPNSANPTAPYASWGTAAANIQDAIDATTEPGGQVVVTNGVYATGQREAYGTTNRLVFANSLTVRSVNGPQFTVIDGAGSCRCVYLSGAILSGFTLTNGAARDGYGGGAIGGTLNDCVLCGNSALFGGGGAYASTLNNCALTGNRVTAPRGDGGGAADCTLNNCTLTGNAAAYGGGTSYSTLNNCIAFFNTGAIGSNYYYGTLNYCCTIPQPTNGVGNMSADPQLASASHLSAASPCRGSGNAAYASGTDIDGEVWDSRPAIGCDEYHVGRLTGALQVGTTTPFTNVATGFAVQFTALIEGRTLASVWDFGDAITISNRPYALHSYATPGDYAVVLRAFNEDHPGGISATVTVHVVSEIHYVAADSDHPFAPYTSWTTAATNIQDAVDVAGNPGALVLVTNGIYAPIQAAKPLAVQSVNGPLFTIIDAARANGCVSLADNASITGFTLTNSGGRGAYGGTLNDCTIAGNSGGGALACRLNNCTLDGNSTAYDGGGAVSCTLNNCALMGNSAGGSGGGTSDCALNNCLLRGNSALSGGGTSGGLLNNCTLNGNRARNFAGGAAYGMLNNCVLTQNSTAGYDPFGRGGGGGAAYCTLNNCTITRNFASDQVLGGGQGAGGYYCAFNNCIVYSNTTPTMEVNYDDNSSVNYSCTKPLPTKGTGNLTNAPLFVDEANGNLRLQANSPCINAGLNALASAGPDLDGNKRIAGGTVDMGAYEFQSPASIISYAWLQQFGLPTDGSADLTDADGDGLNNWQEWRCGTDPTDVLSALRLLTSAGHGTNVTVTWQSVAGVRYSLERASTLAASPAFTSLVTGLPGQPGTTTYSDTNAIGAGPWFYRVGVRIR